MHAYNALGLNFSPCDRIYIFGFSRGAYTARSLAGLLRRCWIVKRENISEADRALDLYRNSKPDSPEAMEFKQKYCHPADAFVGKRDADPVTTAQRLNA